MHNNSTPPPPSSPPRPPPQTRVYPHESEQQLSEMEQILVNDESSSFPWDWSDFLDFNLDDDHFQPLQSLPPEPSPAANLDKIDPRMSCENYLAGLVPCACPEMDAMLAASASAAAAAAEVDLSLPPPPQPIFTPLVSTSAPFLKLSSSSDSRILKSDDMNPLSTSTPFLKPSSSSDSKILKSDKIRKRDPRMSCENFLAGVVPCACPEMDAMLAAEEEEEESGGARKKRARTVRVVGSGILKCQVPGCEADISELKGYHKRHRVCLRCATATDVLLDGQSKRYCQQCGKFHILPDFDEGKRSCRRKLERHNNRRRRKPSDSKGSVEREPQQGTSVEDASCYETGKDNQCTNSQAVEENLLETEGLKSLPSSVNAQHVQSDSIGSGETQIDEEKEKYANSPSYCDDKSAFSSVCPTGRISFKLYDWNPAEFPRRLRHQIFQWLSSMPVELEGYIRPGCTILTLFIAMPKLMWVKLDEDPVACISDLVAPGNMLSGRGTFHVYLNSMMVSVMKGGTSVIKVKVKEHVPKLHYVHPICFEAGKPMQFIACGSNLLQPKFRFLVSLAGKYLKHDVCVLSPCDKAEDSPPTAFDHQFVNICVPHTECNIFGPGFIEVENESGLSNFIPILVADKEICTEIKTMQKRLDLSLYPEDSQPTSSFSHEIVTLRHKKFSGFVSDVAWLLKEPTLEVVDYVLTTSQLQRFTCLLEFLIENKSTKILGRVLYYMKTWIEEGVSTCIPETEMRLFRDTMIQAIDILGEHSEKRLHSKIVVPEENDQRSRDVLSATQFTNQGVEFTGKLDASVDSTITVPLLNRDVIMTMSNLSSKERSRTSCNPVYIKTNRALKSRPVIFVIASAAVCFGICAVLIHPHKASQIVVTIRRCLLDKS